MAKSLHLKALIYLILSSQAAHGQGSRTKEVQVLPSRESQSALIRKAFEAEIHSVLNKYLKAHQYAIDVDFKIQENARNLADVPYAPDSILPDSFQGIPKNDQLKKLQNLTFRIMVPQWMDTSTKTTLKTLLNRRLETLTGSSVNLDIQAVTLNVDEPPKPQPVVSQPAAAAPTMSNQKQQAELDDLKRQWQRERDDLKSEWQREKQDLKDEIKDLQKKLTEAEKAPASPAQVANQTSPTKSSFQEFWDFAKSNPLGAGIVSLLLYFAFFTLAFLPSRSVSSGLGGVQNAFSAIANSIKAVGESIGRSRSMDAPVSEGRPQDRQTQGSGTPSGLAPSSATGHHKNPGPSYPEIRQITNDIQKNHTPELDPMVLEMIQDYLSQDSQSHRAILLLELLGAQHAERLYNQLTMSQKDMVLRLLRSVDRTASDKPDQLFEIAATYQTRKITNGWRANLDKNIVRTLSLLNVNEKVALVRFIKAESTLQRYMLYLDVSELSELLKASKQKPESKQFILRCLAAMPKARDGQGPDQEITSLVAAYVKRKEEDHYQPYLNQYETLIENSGEDIADDILETIKSMNPRVGGQLRQRVVTLSDFFRCPSKMRGEILNSFTNSELALIVHSFDDDKKNLCMNDIDQRRAELVQEQIQMLIDEDKSTIAEKQQILKTRLKKALASRKAEFISEQSDDAYDLQDSENQESAPNLTVAPEDPAAPRKAA